MSKITLEEKWWCISDEHECGCGQIWNKKEWLELKSALKLKELVKAHCNPKCDCEYGNCEHSICEQLIKESEK